MEKLRYDRTFRNGIIVFVLCILLALAFIIPAIISKIQYDKLVSDMKSVEATIVDIDLDLNYRGPHEQEIDITYEVDGVVYNREFGTDTKVAYPAGIAAHYSVGDTVEIFYDPQNPNIIATPRSVYVAYGFLAICLPFLALMVFCLGFALKNRRKFLVTEEEYAEEGRRLKNSELLSKDGQKIRWQYFNTYIYLLFSVLFAVHVMIICMALKEGNFDIWGVIVEMSGATPVLLVMCAIFIGPFIILSILNRFCFGKVLAVVNDSTLFLSNRKVNVCDIIEISYNLGISSRRKSTPCFATFVVKTRRGNTKSFDVLHFPFYGLRAIKKHNPSIKINYDKSIWFLPFLPTVILAVVAFLIG